MMEVAMFVLGKVLTVSLIWAYGFVGGIIATEMTRRDGIAANEWRMIFWIFLWPLLATARLIDWIFRERDRGGNLP